MPSRKSIAELLNRRRRQILVHSIIYYNMNDNLISNSTWSAWAAELEELQAKRRGGTTMSMTREEVIAVLTESKRQNEVMKDNPSTFWASHQMIEGIKNAKRRIEALDIVLTTLRPVSREQVEQMRGEWIQDECGQVKCSRCGGIVSIGGKNALHNAKRYDRFCFCCGVPMTDEAVDIRLKELEALKDGKGD